MIIGGFDRSGGGTGHRHTTEFEAGIEGEAVTFGSIMKERYIAVFDVLDVRLGTVVEGFGGQRGGGAWQEVLVRRPDLP
ncbi:MAG: hypothetical protein IPH55_19765 [Betaproteobacteria bacterium]|nr:hypothetical protein [Betaproteobacteria bacterium]